MFIHQLWTTWQAAGLVVLSGLCALAAVIATIHISVMHGDGSIDDVLMSDIRVLA